MKNTFSDLTLAKLTPIHMVCVTLDIKNFNLRFRYKWEHAVLREDITSRRVCLAYRELTPPYLPDETGNCSEESVEVLERALNFW